MNVAVVDLSIFAIEAAMRCWKCDPPRSHRLLTNSGSRWRDMAGFAKRRWMCHRHWQMAVLDGLNPPPTCRVSEKGGGGNNNNKLDQYGRTLNLVCQG